MTDRPLIEGLLSTLRELPDVTAEVDGVEQRADNAVRIRIDAMLDVTVAGTRITVVVEIRKQAYPRDVQQGIWQLRAATSPWQSPVGAQVVPLFAAHSISPGAKVLLRQERIGYFDSGGSLYLQAPGVYLYLDRPPPKSFEKSLRSLFSPRRAQVLQVLLLRQIEWFQVGELAQAAAVSAPTVSQVLTELERLDWLETQGRGRSKRRHLREPATLLDTWVQQLLKLSPPVQRHYFVPSQKAETLADAVGAALGAQGAHYGLTAEAAAQRYAPFLSHVAHVRVRAERGARVQRALDALGARAVSEGSNLSIIETEPDTELVAPECRDGLWLANPVQVYLDLLRGAGRSSEFAAHLRRLRLGY